MATSPSPCKCSNKTLPDNCGNFRIDGRFWQERYYDFNVWSEAKRVEKLRYIHRNPVKRGLVERPEDWAWSSFQHYISGIDGVVEIESHWTARKRALQGWTPQCTYRDENPRPVAKVRDKDGAPHQVGGLKIRHINLGNKFSQHKHLELTLTSGVPSLSRTFATGRGFFHPHTNKRVQVSS